LSYNEKTTTFPSVVIANTFNFQPEQFFEAEDEARADIHVSFAAGTPETATPATTPAPPAAPST
jgi:hypothetical protein